MRCESEVSSPVDVEVIILQPSETAYFRLHGSLDSRCEDCSHLLVVHEYGTEEIDDWDGLILTCECDIPDCKCYSEDTIK